MVRVCGCGLKLCVEVCNVCIKYFVGSKGKWKAKYVCCIEKKKKKMYTEEKKEIIMMKWRKER